MKKWKVEKRDFVYECMLRNGFIWVNLYLGRWNGTGVEIMVLRPTVTVASHVMAFRMNKNTQEKEAN